VFRKPLAIRTQRPLISFTFDDFPRSAFLAGGAVLSRYGLAGTYYTALGLLGTDGPSGPLYLLDDLKAVLANGHELGCHTFSHCHSWDTQKDRFEDSIIQNRGALTQLLPGAEFKSLSYPISEPRPLTKRAVSKYFLCCRGGGQTINIGRADLNQLAAYFLEKSSDNIQEIRNLIDANREARGWIIFATHDISHNPSPYGCTPDFFETVVQYALSSGAYILPVVRAVEEIRSQVRASCQQ
jgi:peptidoglycan/xylan/chitin deacetylase (PgdA/CDA1 family)